MTLKKDDNKIEDHGHKIYNFKASVTMMVEHEFNIIQVLNIPNFIVKH